MVAAADASRQHGAGGRLAQLPRGRARMQVSGARGTGLRAAWKPASMNPRQPSLETEHRPGDRLGILPRPSPSHSTGTVVSMAIGDVLASAAAEAGLDSGEPFVGRHEPVNAPSIRATSSP